MTIPVDRMPTVAADLMVRPGDTRYDFLASRGRGNPRFTAQPDEFWMARSTDDVVTAVQHAVDRGARTVVRSGGHCFEGFVDDPAVQVIVDTALMADVDLDPDMQAFVVGAGARLGDLYRRLYLGWGVSLPAGESPDIGVGGHILGGGYGFQSRLHGLAVDHLQAVEVVVVDASGTARAVVATRADDDPNRDLWWAHTGGGGGNFGIVTRYWLRSPDADAAAGPTALLPTAPSSVLTFTASWRWSELGEAGFARLVDNFGDWCERHVDDDGPSSGIFATLLLYPRASGSIEIEGQSLGPVEDHETLVTGFLDAIGAGIDAVPSQETERSSWLDFALTRHPGGIPGRVKVKDAFLRRRLDDRQVATLHRQLTTMDLDEAEDTFIVFALDTYGGRVNQVPEDATAAAQRDSVLHSYLIVAWPDADHDDEYLTLAREMFGSLFADTGGVPAPRTGADGSFINHPDIDYADARWNTSGIPWPTLYYKDNYPALQRIKARWDPSNVFRHALSVTP